MKDQRPRRIVLLHERTIVPIAAAPAGAPRADSAAQVRKKSARDHPGPRAIVFCCPPAAVEDRGTGGGDTMRQVNVCMAMTVVAGLFAVACRRAGGTSGPDLQGGACGSRRGPIDDRLQAGTHVLLSRRSGRQSRAAGHDILQGRPGRPVPALLRRHSAATSGSSSTPRRTARSRCGRWASRSRPPPATRKAAS